MLVIYTATTVLSTSSLGYFEFINYFNDLLRLFAELLITAA